MRWVGRTEGDHRVVSYDKRKVYSCPESAGIDNEVRGTQIEAICNKLIRPLEGVNVDWYAQYCLEHEDITIVPHEAPVYWVDRPAPSHRKYLQKMGVSIEQHRGKIPRILRLIETVFDNMEVEVLSMYTSDLLEELEKIAVYRGFSLNSTHQAFAKHIRTHQVIYHNILDMELTTKYRRRSGRQVSYLTIHKPKKYTKKDIYLYDDQDSYLMNARGKSKPVMQLDTQRVFGSISTAARVIKAKRELVLWNCKGEIPYVKTEARRYQFVFVKFKEER